MAITFDKTLNVIGVGGTIVTIQELIDAIRDWEDGVEGIAVRSVANAYGKQSLGTTEKVGITLELINNWRVQFEEKSVWTNCYIKGGNLVAVNDYDNDPIKPSAYVNTIVAQSSSPTLVYSEGGGGVWTEEEKTLVLSGTSTLLTNTGSLLISTSALLDHTDSILTDTASILTGTSTIGQVNLNRWKIGVESKQLVYYGTTGNEIVRFNLFDRFGESAVDDVFERVPV